MNDAAIHERHQFQRALASVEATLAKLRMCPPAERERLRRDIDHLEAMYAKTTEGRVEIAVFGEISTGKSALINALIGAPVAAVDVQGGWTKTVQAARWENCAYRVPGFERSEVVLIDTPGINEVGGRERDELAETTARQSDLILFAIDSDINETEYAALIELAVIRKPLIVVMNKRDLYGDLEWSRLAEAVVRRIADQVPREHVVATAADPRAIEVVIERSGGRSDSRWEKPSPDVAALKQLILTTLAKEGLELIALNAALYAADKNDRVAALRVEMRNRRADQVIWTMAATKATVVALAPTVIDVVSGIASDAAMIVILSKVYGLNFSMVQARRLARAIAHAAGIFALGELVSWGASAVKLASIHLATPLTMLPQGSAAGFSSYIIGQAAKYYFEHGGAWGAASPKHVVRQILDQADRDSILAHLKDEIRRQLAWNRHGRIAEKNPK
jgi:hypothetical protein